MATPLLTTKLYIPSSRPDLVSRPRLIERLDEGLLMQNGGFARKLTLVSAPAGFGKTTLLSEWVQQHRDEDTPPLRFAWLSLDEGDNDLTRFLAYFVAALQTVEVGVGAGVLSLLQSPQSPPTEAILTALINEVSESTDKDGRVSNPIVLVLDDYHLITDQPIHEALGFLLNHLPPTMHLVLIGRVDPPFSLSRLRVQRVLTEIRTNNLRFTEIEAAAFLNDLMNLDLAPDEIAALETRTEGWIASLQLAALSLQGRQDKKEFVAVFSGSHHYVIDYLVDEVMSRQPEEIRTFLCFTSILNRFCAPLCNAVVNISNGKEILQKLEEANLFLIPMDDERRWYRYHHLFSDFLSQRLSMEESVRVALLHKRASVWHEHNGFIEEAVKHSLSAEDFEQAARLIEILAEVLWERGEPTTLLRWLEALPDDQISSRPNLCNFYAWVLFMNGQNQAAELWLQAAERTLDSASAGLNESPPESPDRLKELDIMEQKGRVATIRSSIAFRQGDVPAIFQFSHQALEYLPEKSLIWRCITTMALGMAQDLSGDTTAAHGTLTEAVAISKESGISISY